MSDLSNVPPSLRFLVEILQATTTGSILTHWPLGNFNEILNVIFKQILAIDGWGICCEIALIWMSLDFTDDQSTLVQVMAWCRQATSHCLSQYWPRSLSPYGVTRPPSFQVKGFSQDCLIIIMGIFILVRWHLNSEMVTMGLIQYKHTILSKHDIPVYR